MAIATIDRSEDHLFWIERAALGHTIILTTFDQDAGLSSATLALHALENKLRKAELINLRGDVPVGHSIALQKVDATTHESCWIAAADLHEKAVAYFKSGCTPEFVFCIDPWAANLKMPLSALAQKSKWIFISDAKLPRLDADCDYWTEFDTWLNTQQFDAVLDVRELFAFLPDDYWKGADQNSLHCALRAKAAENPIVILDFCGDVELQKTHLANALNHVPATSVVILLSSDTMELKENAHSSLLKVSAALRRTWLSPAVYRAILNSGDIYVAPDGCPFGYSSVSFLRDGSKVFVSKNEFDSWPERDRRRLQRQDLAPDAEGNNTSRDRVSAARLPGTPQFSQWWRSLTALNSTAGAKHSRRFSILTCCHKYLQRFRVFLDSIIRQAYPLDQIEVCVALPGNPDGVDEYLQLIRQIHPALSIISVKVSEAIRKNRGRQINEAFRESTGDIIIVNDCDIVLPKYFCERIQRGYHHEAVIGCWRTALSPEVTAHILTGNLDPVENFELLKTQWDEEERKDVRQGVLGYCQILARKVFDTVLYPEEFDQINQSDIVFIERLNEKLGVNPRMLEDLFVLHLAHPRNWSGTQVFL